MSISVIFCLLVLVLDKQIHGLGFYWQRLVPNSQGLVLDIFVLDSVSGQHWTRVSMLTPA